MPMLKPLLDGLLTLLRHPAFWVVLIIGIVITGFVRQGNELKDQREARVVVEKTLEITKGDLGRAIIVIESTKERIVANQKELDSLGASNKQLEEKLNEAKSKLDTYRSRERIASSKPALVESRANAATKRVFNELSCSTGNTKLCDDQTGKTYTFDRTGN